MLLLLWVGVLGGGVIGYFALTLPDTSRLAQSQRRPSVTILAADGSLLTTYGDLFGRPLLLKQMSPHLPQAVIATEDRRFYSHFGIDPIGMLRAAMADLAAGRVVEGGSTITQQLAKNLFLTPERSVGRKIRETLLALWLEHRFTKDEILEIYLNRVYLGAGTYGVDAAAHRYFGNSAARLDLYQSAMIAGLLKAPARFNPTRDRELAAARTAQVLANMVEAGCISQSEATAAGREAGALGAIAVARPGTRYFADWIAAQVTDFAGPDSRDLTVVTTLDPRMQAAAEQAVAGTIARDGARASVSQGALVAMSPDGAVRAMVGGRSYDSSQFNRATQAERQPGSAFKPFVYLAGLEAGLRPSDHFVDGPIQVGRWRPRDYGRRYQGDMTLAEALAQSVNTIAVQVTLRAGIDNIVAVAHRLGIALAADPRRQHRARHRRGEPVGADLGLCAVRQWRHGSVALRHRRGARQPRAGRVPPFRLGSRTGRRPRIGGRDERHAGRGHRSWHRRRRPAAAPGRRQDRNHPGLPRRLVYRLHRRSRRRRVARQ